MSQTEACLKFSHTEKNIKTILVYYYVISSSNYDNPFLSLSLIRERKHWFPKKYRL